MKTKGKDGKRAKPKQAKVQILSLAEKLRAAVAVSESSFFYRSTNAKPPTSRKSINKRRKQIQQVLRASDHPIINFNGARYDGVVSLPVPETVLIPGTGGSVSTARYMTKHNKRFHKYVLLRPVVHHHDNVTTLWHGTDLSASGNIVIQGLKPGKKWCMFGAAVYCGGIKKAAGFTRGVILKVRVALGKVHVAATNLSACPVGFDSVQGRAGYTQGSYGALQSDEYAVYDESRVSVIEVYIDADYIDKAAEKLEEQKKALGL